MIEIPTSYDLEREPPALVCGQTGRSEDERGCGREWRWEWYAPHGGLHAPRWCAPAVSPCSQCKPSPELEEEREIKGRMLRAGVPEPLLHVDLQRVVIQRHDETDEHFRARVRRDHQLGVPVVNAGALARLRNWRPRDERGRAQWLVLHGSPGTGKTTMLAALARKLLARPPERTEVSTKAAPLPLPGQRTLRRARLHGALYERCDELVRREELKLRGLDPKPLVDTATDPRVLLLDEVGLAERPPESEVKLVERLICHRHDAGLVTVLATNRTWGELTDEEKPLYGWRVADRLRAATEVELGGASWRAP